VCGVALLGVNWEVFLHVRVMGIAALVALLLAALAIGHALGGPAPDDRTALAVACSTRHIGLAVLVAASFPGSRSAVLVAVYILVSMLVTLPYLRWRRWRAGLQASDGAAV
jgi:bile acid:Na+ symporter, BASS family